jgi:hypothetical protein
VADGLTLGIDLAAQPARTATCVIRWSSDGRGSTQSLDHGRTDADLLKWMVSLATRVAIDAPFGWPVEFIEEIRQFAETGTLPWPDDFDEHRRRLRHRATDREIQERLGLTPPSVSTDRVAAVALRCVRLLSAHWEHIGEPPDRSGQGRVLETYPAAALRQWRLAPFHGPLDPGTYKGPSPRAVRCRQQIVRNIERYGQGWLEMSPSHAEECVQSHHKLDALLCALVARAAETDHIVPVTDPARAAVEGWIRVPTERPLSRLGGVHGMDLEWLEEEPLIPAGGYLELQMPEQFELEVQDAPGGTWMTWAAVLRAEWFDRQHDGSYVCTGHDGPPVWIRALSLDPGSKVIEHADHDGHVYHYRLPLSVNVT